MEGVRLMRWVLSPIPTFLLWRRMKLWELRSYEQVIKLEQERLVYQARLRSRFGRAWRRKAPVESLMPLRLARFGVPLANTAADGLAAAGIEPQLLPAPPAGPELEQGSKAAPSQGPARVGAAEEGTSQWFAPPPHTQTYQGDYDADFEPPATYVPESGDRAWYQQQSQQIPVPHPRAPEPEPAPVPVPAQAQAPEPVAEPTQVPVPESELEPQFQVPNGAGGTRPLGEGVQEALPSNEELYQVFRQSIEGEGLPTPGAFAANAEAAHGLRLQGRELHHYMDQFAARLNNELMEDHIA
jgi:hypothetical protein